MEPVHHQEKEQFKRLFEDEGIDQIDDRLAILKVFLGIELHISFQEFVTALKDKGYSFEPDFVKKTLNLLGRYGFAAKKKFEEPLKRYRPDVFCRFTGPSDTSALARCSRQRLG